MSLQVGSAARDISPRKPLFLYGYPHVPRTSTGIHDPLLASAFYLADGQTELLTIALDLEALNHNQARAWRAAIEKATGIPAGHILISATHTHSGPVVAEYLACSTDPVVPPPDAEYLAELQQGVIEAATAAKQVARPAALALASARVAGIGGNRLEPQGLHDREVGLLCARSRDEKTMFALLAVYAMHPTVLHEDSTLVSSDFIHYTRRHLAEALPGITVVYHTGTAGNLSPRYHVKGQTFAEAERLGRTLGEQILPAIRALREADFQEQITLAAAREFVALPTRRYPTIEQAEQNLADHQAEYGRLKRAGAPRALVRTQECVIFGAEEMLAMARFEATGRVDKLRQEYARVELQVLRVGDAFVVGLPGELFVEYGLRIKRGAPGRALVISLANGELQGYIVTPEAAAAGGYEAQMSFFPAVAGDILATTTLNLMQKLAAPSCPLTAASSSRSATSTRVP